MRMLPLSMLAILLWCMDPVPLLAQQVGDKVVVIVDQTEIKVGTEAINATRGEVFVVQELQGDRFGIDTPRGSGSIPKRQVIPLSQAIAHWSGVIGTNPRDAGAFAARAIAYQQLQNFDKAVADYTEGIRLDPKQAAIYYNRGNVHAATGKSDKAIADFTEAIRLNPKFVAAYVNRGATWDPMRDNDKAIADYNEAIRLDPKSASAYLNRGHSWGRKRDTVKQMADYNEAIRLNPRSILAFYSRGQARESRGDYAQALADFSEAVKLNPKFASAFNNRAWIWATCPDAKVRDGKRAVESASRLCELEGFDDSGNLDTLAAAYAESGDFTNAVKWQSKAVELAPAADKADLQSRVDLYRAKKPYHEPPKK